MKKRFLAIVLCLVMAFPLLPATAFAEGLEVRVGYKEMQDNTYLANDASEVSSNKPATGGYAYLSGNTLTLHDFSYIFSYGNDAGSQAVISATADLIIVLEGTNSVTYSDAASSTHVPYYGIRCTGNLTIQGTGTLHATGGAAIGSAPKSYGICSDHGDITISGGAITATGGPATEDAPASYGIFAGSGNIIISGGAITATGGTATGQYSQSYGFYADEEVKISNGTLTAAGGTADGEPSTARAIGNASARIEPTAGVALRLRTSDTPGDLSTVTMDETIYYNSDPWNNKITAPYAHISPLYAVSGTVTYQDVATSAAITVTGPGNHSTGSEAGYYEIYLEPGTHTITATADVDQGPDSPALFVVGSTTVTVTDRAVTAPDISLAVPAPQPTRDRDRTPSEVTVYNNANRSDANVWLSGTGLKAGDLLITNPIADGGDYNALLRLAGSEEVIGVYDISLKSGATGSGSAMYLHFGLGAGYAGQAFTLVHKNADGTLEFFYATADANGDLKFGPLYSLSPFMLTTGTLPDAAGKVWSMDNFKASGEYPGFEDVDESRWYGTEQEAVIRDAFLLGLMAGDGDGNFRPEDPVKIAEVIKLAALLTDTYYAEGHNFTQGAPWYQVYVDYATEAGIIEADDFADYTAVCTRAQAAYILANALPESGLAPISELTPPDVAKSDQYGAGIYRLYAAGVLRGNDEEATFAPAGAFTRAQSAAILTRLTMPENRL